MKKFIIYYLILISFATKAQEKDKFLPKGNEEFAEKNMPMQKQIIEFHNLNSRKKQFPLII